MRAMVLLDEGEEAAITKVLLVMDMTVEEVHQAVSGVTLGMKTVDPLADKDLMADRVEHMIPRVPREVMMADMQVVKGTGVIRIDMMTERTVRVNIQEIITQGTTGEEGRRITEDFTLRAPPGITEEEERMITEDCTLRALSGGTKAVTTGSIETTEDEDKMTGAEMNHMGEVTVVLQGTEPVWSPKHPPGTLGREAGAGGMSGRTTTTRGIMLELHQTDTLPIWSPVAHRRMVHTPE